MNRITKGLAAVGAGALIVAGSLGAASAALADDTAAPAAPTQEVASSPAPTDSQTDSPAATQPDSSTGTGASGSTDEATSPTPSTPDSSATPAAPAGSPATDESAAATSQRTAPDHIDSAADPIQQAAAPEAKGNNAAGDEWFTWRLAVDTLPADQQGHVGAKAEWFPQPPIGKGQIAPVAGTCVQQDHYTGPRHKLDALYAAPLTWNAKAGHASDNDVPGVKVVDWTIICTPPAPPVVNPQPCVAGSGGWYPEDVAPEQTADGLLFQGQGSAVDYYHPISGNLQGFTSQSVTFAQVAGYQPSITLVLNRQGTSGYANLVAEWYMNGGSASTDGTFSAGPSTLWWTNKIASGAGSQSNPQPLAFFADLWPNNALLAVGPHLGSAQQSDTHSVVTAVSGCVSDSFVPTKPEPEVITGDWKDGEYGCGDTTQTQTRTITTTPYVWKDGGYVLDTMAATETTETQTVDLTAEQIAALNCPTTPPTDTPTSTPTPGTVATPTDSGTPQVLVATGEDTLAHTGSSVNYWPAAIAAILAVLAGAGIGVATMIRRRTAK